MPRIYNICSMISTDNIPTGAIDKVVDDHGIEDMKEKWNNNKLQSVMNKRARSMSGEKKGVQAFLKKEITSLTFILCGNHTLNLFANLKAVLMPKFILEWCKSFLTSSVRVRRDRKFSRSMLRNHLETFLKPDGTQNSLPWN